jgi:serine/threonine protein phosphatase PrpC
MNIQSSGYALPRREDAACDDAWCIREHNGALIAVLADGVGSAREGGLAARRAVEMLADYYFARPRSWSPRRALGEFTTQINRHLHTDSLAQHGQPELACTLCAVVVEDQRVFGCNVGDSPVFQWRRGRLARLSEVHALTQPGYDHVLTRALGLAPDVEPYLFEAELAPGDLILLCSDGVTTALDDDRLTDLLARQATARTVVTAARLATEENIELRDDTCAVVLDLGAAATPAEALRHRTLEVLPVPRAGDLVAEHRLVRPLAGNDRVWLAESADRTPVVLKFPPVDALESEPLRAAFVREARNAVRLESPDLVRAWVPGGSAFFCYAMEFVNAPTLRSVLLTERLGVEDARELGRFLLRVGQFLLRHDLAHGDLKPENILVLREAGGCSFRLLDLGSAAELFSVTSRAGTASYLAPERFHGTPLSERTEIFAIGVTLYEALTGAYPYGEIERFQTPKFSAPRPVVRQNPAAPAWLDSIIQRAIEADPERRYQHFSEMAYDLAHPEKVTPHHAKGAPLLERNPLRFYQMLSLVLFGTVLVLLHLVLNR